MEPFSIRLNTLTASYNTLVSRLSAYAQEGRVEPVSWYDHAFILHNVSRDVFLEGALVTEGNFYVQNLSSMLAPLALSPQPHTAVLDMCAAPGGKTIQIADMMGNTGAIIANDMSRARVFKLKALCARYGVANTTFSVGPGEFLWRRHGAVFDAVLVDAPCSMDDGRSLKEVKALARRQSYLIRSAFACVKLGGTVVYSTCTSTEEENEGVVDAILARVEGVALCPIPLPPLPEARISSRGEWRISKHGLYGTFFIARFTRAHQ